MNIQMQKKKKPWKQMKIDQNCLLSPVTEEMQITEKKLGMILFLTLKSILPTKIRNIMPGLIIYFIII